MKNDRYRPAIIHYSLFISVKGAVLSRAALLLLKSIQKPDLVKKLPAIFDLFRDLLEQKRGLDYVRTFLYYIAQTANKIQPDELNKLIHENLKSGDENIMATLAEQWIHQGFEKGIEKGIEKGKLEAKLEDARSLHSLGVGIDIICKATGLSLEFLKKEGIGKQ